MRSVRPMARKVGIALVAVFAVLGIMFVGMVAYEYMRIDNEQRAGVSSTSSTSAPSYTPQSYTPPSATTSAPKEQGPLFEFGEGRMVAEGSYIRYYGSLTNISGAAHRFVKVRGTFTDAGGSTIDTDWTYACGDEGLRPGETTKFTLSVRKDSRITNITVNVYDFD